MHVPAFSAERMLCVRVCGPADGGASLALCARGSCVCGDRPLGSVGVPHADGTLLPVYVETEIYRALLESAASEQGARMTAMRNASKSAGEVIDSLTLAMNRARQSEITQEILEVVAGADALTA